MYVLLFSGCHDLTYTIKPVGVLALQELLLLVNLKRWFSFNVLLLYSQLESPHGSAWTDVKVPQLCLFWCGRRCHGICFYCSFYLSLASVIFNRWRADWLPSGELNGSTVVLRHGRSFDLELIISEQCPQYYSWTSAGKSDFFLYWERFFKSAMDVFILLRTFLQLAHLICMKNFMF